MLPQVILNTAENIRQSPDVIAPSTYPVVAALPFLIIASCILFLVPEAPHFLTDTNHGYQLALGMTFAQGAMPGLNTVTQYGPLVSTFTLLAWQLSGNIVAEVVICALGYAAAIALCFDYLRRHASRVIAILAAAALILTMAPFYKWYYWLTPLIGLQLSDAYRARVLTGRPTAALLIAWGCYAGAAWLMRVDLWLEAAVFGLLMIGAVQIEQARLGRMRSVATLAGAMVRHGLRQVLPGLAIIAGFLALVWMHGGTARLTDLLMGTQDGVVDTVVAYRIAPFDFIASPIVCFENVLASLQVLVPLLYGAGLLIGTAETWRGQGETGFPLIAVSLTGLGVLPQALHRADLPHLFQVLPPFILLFGLLLARLERAVWHFPARMLTGATLGVVAFFLLICGLRGPGDLVYAARNPLPIWQAIAALPEGQPADPTADMALAIRRATPRGARGYYLMAMTPSPLIFFAQRRQAGLFPIHEPGMYASPYWIPRNRERLAQEPPDFIVVGNAPADPPEALPPELARQWREAFTRVVHRNDRFTLLLRP